MKEIREQYLKETGIDIDHIIRTYPFPESPERLNQLLKYIDWHENRGREPITVIDLPYYLSDKPLTSLEEKKAEAAVEKCKELIEKYPAKIIMEKAIV